MRQITYHIHRYQQGRAFVQTFKFDYEADRTILWGLQKIKDTQDPTLTFLAACRSAVCGATKVTKSFAKLQLTSKNSLLVQNVSFVVAAHLNVTN